MDRKRKSVFSTTSDGHNPLMRYQVPDAEQKKIYQQDCHTKTSTPKKVYPADNPQKSHSNHLKPLTSEAVGIHHKGDASLRPNVSRDIPELNNSGQGGPYLAPTSTPKVNTTVLPAAAQTRNGRGLPALPPISDEKLAKAVFTHPGVSSDPRTTYDRLEILGDAYIELIATRLIWETFNEIPSGRISQIRELLVKNETLSEYATQYGLDTRASVPQDHLNQPKRWIKTRGDIFEAYVAAVILSNPNGYSIAETWLSQLWSPKLDLLQPPESLLNAKEALAKKLMRKGVTLKYVDEQPPVQHGNGQQTFFIGVYFSGWGWDNRHLGSGQGPKKTIAGNRAAQQALENTQLLNAIVKAKPKPKENETGKLES